MIDAADWSFPIPVAFGPGRIAELGTHCLDAGSTRPLVVTDRGSVDLPFIGAALDALASAGATGAVFAEVSPNPTDADIALGREAFLSGGHDGVVAIGGGSGMDAGKSISLVARNEFGLAALNYDVTPPPGITADSFVPLITVPTTAGTGAETESTAMVTVAEEGVKICVWHELQKPVVAILDPELTLGLPPALTAWTGVDALVHAIEAYSVPAWHPMCDGLAVESLRLIARALERAVDDGSDLDARSTMLVGSCMAGVSFLKGLGLVHGISHMIGAVYDTHHGLTNAVMLPSVLRYNENGITGKVEVMCDALGVVQRDFDGLTGWIDELLDRLDIPTSLASIGVGDDRITELATKAMLDAATATNPTTASVGDIETLLTTALTNAR